MEARRLDMKKWMTAALAAALATGCTWVTPAPDSENIRVATAEEVASCERRGKTTSKTAAKIGPFGRGDEKMAEELATLARNEAPGLGGDTVVPESEIEDGRQTFGVYSCGNPE
jgi:hypothetical protein